MHCMCICVCLSCPSIYTVSVCIYTCIYTGTLTRNIMDFRKMSINGQKYGEYTLIVVYFFVRCIYVCYTCTCAPTLYIYSLHICTLYMRLIVVI